MNMENTAAPGIWQDGALRACTIVAAGLVIALLVWALTLQPWKALIESGTFVRSTGLLLAAWSWVVGVLSADRLGTLARAATPEEGPSRKQPAKLLWQNLRVILAPVAVATAITGALGMLVGSRMPQGFEVLLVGLQLLGNIFVSILMCLLGLTITLASGRRWLGLLVLGVIAMARILRVWVMFPGTYGWTDGGHFFPDRAAIWAQDLGLPGFGVISATYFPVTTPFMVLAMIVLWPLLVAGCLALCRRTLTRRSAT